MRTIQRNIASAFFVSKDGKVLLGKNRKGGVFEGSYAVPGGGIEEGESKEQGLRREMLEETGIDVRGLKATQVNLFDGSHPKTLQDSGERVMVDMTFNDYRIDLDEDAVDVQVIAGDDWSSPRWFSVDELATESIADFTAVTLKKMNFWPEAQALKAVLFDVDGTLVDTEKLQSDAYALVLKQYGHEDIEPTKHGTIHFPGEATNDTWLRLIKQYPIDEEIQKLAGKKREAAMELLKAGVAPMRGAVELLRSLHEGGVKIALVSSALRDRLTLMVDALGIADYVDVIVSGDDALNHKPAPDSYLLAVQKLGVNADECVVIEDAEVGVQAANAAGIKVVAVPNDYTMQMDFQKATTQANSLSELSYEWLAAIVSGQL